MDTPEFKRLQKYFNRMRRKEERHILDQILIDLKKKHEREKQDKINALQKQIDKLRS